MSLVNITNVIVLDNPTCFKNPFQFEITFECLQELGDDLEWKVIYVGSAEDSKHDQTLEEVMVGPVPVGVNKFVLQAPSPEFHTIPQSDILGVTVVLVTCSYLDHEFIRIGYYVNNEYADPLDPELPLPTLEVDKIYRNILADQPRVTRFPIDWSGESYKQNETNAPLEIQLSEDEMPCVEDGEGDDLMTSNNEEEDEDEEDDEEDDDDMAEVELGDGEDSEDGEESEEEVCMEGEQMDHMVMMNEDSMDVARMQSNFNASEVHAGATVMRFH